jgi:hypothetical protein
MLCDCCKYLNFYKNLLDEESSTIFVYAVLGLGFLNFKIGAFLAVEGFQATVPAIESLPNCHHLTQKQMGNSNHLFLISSTNCVWIFLILDCLSLRLGN